MDSPVTNIFSLPVEEGEMQFENFGKYLEFIPADKHNLYRMLFRFASLIQIHFFAKITRGEYPGMDNLVNPLNELLAAETQNVSQCLVELAAIITELEPEFCFNIGEYPEFFTITDFDTLIGEIDLIANLVKFLKEGIVVISLLSKHWGAGFGEAREQVEALVNKLAPMRKDIEKTES